MKKTLLAIALLAITATAQAQNDWASGKTYVYDAAGNIVQIANDVYQYDSVDRLVSGETNDRQRQYTYDAFGNRTNCTDVTSGGNCQGVNILPGTNRVGGANYDAAGNLTQFGTDTYTYDPVNMLQRDTSAPMAREYVYTADDERIAVIVGSTWNWTLRDLSAKVLREMTSTAGAGGTHTNWQWTRDNVWRDGLLLASRQTTSGTVGTFHYHLDHLGTPRVVSNANDTIVGNHDYFPFGMELSGNTDESPENRHKFTGHERDDFAGDTEPLDYMHARYYSGGWGRFLSVDPKLNLKRALLQPQNWNRYSYVMNNPLKYTDPKGEDVSIRLHFKGDGWTDDEKKKIIAQVTAWYQKQNVGKVFVFDGAKASHGGNLFTRLFNSVAYTSIKVSSGTGSKHSSDTVFAGNYNDLPGEQRINAISNSIVHETAAHHFGATFLHREDYVKYERDKGWEYYTAIRSRYGTVADSHAYRDERTRGNVTNGPIPIKTEDLMTLRGVLGPLHVEPPDDDD